MKAAALALLLLGSLAAGRPARAGSMCRCGDPTFNALGTDVYAAGKFRLALDWDRFEKESAAMEGGRDHEVENRFTATLSYSFGETVTVVARVPWSARRLTTDAETVRASGLSDPELYALVRVWAAPFAAGMGQRAWLSLLGGVKAPWGRNEVSEGRVRLDEHVQPGTGSTDTFGGVSFVFLVDPSSSLFASAQYRRNGSNDSGYRYGDVVLTNVAYERKLTGALDGVIELNYRHAERDRADSSGLRDPNTGGGILYVTPRAVVDFGHGLVGRVSVQIPVVDSLYGDQTERAVVSAGGTVLF